MAIDSGEKTYLSHTAQQVDDAIDAAALKVSDVTYTGSTGKLQKTIGSNTTDILTVDATPTENSTNPVKSGGVYTMLAAKQDIIKVVDVQCYLNSLNFIQSTGTGQSDGIWYIPSADAVSITGISNIFAVSICDWGSLLDTEVVQPYISANGTKISFLSNVGTFRAATSITIRAIGI